MQVWKHILQPTYILDNGQYLLGDKSYDRPRLTMLLQEDVIK
jgi:hypothetical protein